MFHLIRTIVQNYIENSNCFHIVAKDGITTDQFAIYKSDSLFVKVSLNMRQVQLHIPAILRSASVARNLDYYQNKICHEIPSIHDTEQAKLILQKLRVIIITLFLRLNRLMVEIESDRSPNSYNSYFIEWNKHSEEVLMVTSTLLVGYHQGKTETKILDSIKKTLEYLGISISMLDDEISYLY